MEWNVRPSPANTSPSNLKGEFKIHVIHLFQHFSNMEKETITPIEKKIKYQNFHLDFSIYFYTRIRFELVYIIFLVLTFSENKS